jgi:hypothetical protein
VKESQYQQEKKLWSAFRGGMKNKKDICLSENDFSAYLEGRIRGKRLRIVEEHLAACSFCLHSLIELRSCLHTQRVDPPQEIVERAKELVEETVHVRGVHVPELVYGLKYLFFHPKKALVWACALVLTFLSCFAGLKCGQDTLLFSSGVAKETFEDPPLNEIETLIDLFGLGDTNII